MPKIHLVLIIHAHQPVGNFDHVFEQLYRQSYLPFLEQVERHPAIRLGLHYTGPLLEWLDARHPEFLERLAALVHRHQVEIIGGAFYEPILISIPRADQAEQIRRMRAYLLQRFGQAPSGAWLAERVWEPHLPAIFEAAQVDYTLLDDIHFLCAGLEAEQLFGYYVAEEGGATVKVIPGLQAMRYLVPFHTVDESIAYLRDAAGRHPDGMVATGDDCEKFGGWPGTYEHCYTNGWLDKFFTAVEKNSDWLATTPPDEYLATHAPLGRAGLPAASYTEMMEWVLPTPARQQFHALESEFASRPDVTRFLRGGIWRGFLTKYSEVNLLHKKALSSSRRLHAMRAQEHDRAAEPALEQAHTHILRAQCNDAYWHGIFGGIYAPHLRSELYRELLHAEALLDRAAGALDDGIRVEKTDFDLDGQQELCVRAPQLAAIVKPSDGATIAALDFRPTAVTLINSLMRRPEAYHARLAEAARGTGASVASIHEQTRSKEPGLEKHLRYDRWPRHSFRLLLFPVTKTHADYEVIELGESASFAAGAYAASGAAISRSGARLEFSREASLDLRDLPWPAGALLRAQKTLEFETSGDAFAIRCAISLSHTASIPLRLHVGLESVLNLLAPNVPDRYFEFGGARHPLRWSGETRSHSLRAADEWQDVSATLEASGGTFWIAPIDTVSESEEGFERVYQGSQILALWTPELQPGAPWQAELMLRVSKAHA